MTATTLDGVLLHGTAASRPAANAVAKGTLYSATDTGAITQSDGVSTWATFATITGSPSGSITASGYTMTTARMLGRTTASTGAIEEITVGSGLSLSAGSLTATGSAGNYIQLADSLLGSDTASFDFTSISGSYKHLRVECSARSTVSSTVDVALVRFNNDSGSNYDYATLTMGASSSPPGNVTEGLGATGMRVAATSGASSTAGDVGTFTLAILDYAATTLNKSCHAEGYATLDRSTGNVRMTQGGGTWRSTSAITRVTILPVTGPNWKAGSRATLYGMN